MSCVARGIVLRQMDRLFRDGTLTGLGDGQLLERYLTRRDEDAFEALVDLHGPMVLGLCRRMLRDPRDIEDAFQATFLVLVRKAPAIRDRNLLSNWLYGVAFRVARRARTRTLRRRDRETPVGEPEVEAGPEPTDPAERTEFDATLDQELNRLPEKYRAPLVLCYLRGRTHDQAAEELRCPVGTVRSRMARGRDLLRDRLTRRGFAPTAMAAILGGDPITSARLLVATVPPPLAAATVRVALAFGSSHIFQAGVSSLALAQGVLTTMRIAQLKWIGLAAVATGLSTGGVIAAVYASVAMQEAPTARDATAVVVSDPTKKKAEAPPPAPTMEARLRSLEDKIDQLMGRSILPPSFDTRFAPTQFESKDGHLSVRPTQAPPTLVPSIGELEAQLERASAEYERVKELFQRGAVAVVEAEQARNKALIIAGQVEAIDDGIRDELDRLRLERRRKVAQLEKAGAEVEVATALVARNNRLNQRKPGMVAAEEVAKNEGELKVATAASRIAEVEIAEVDLRIRQLDRRSRQFMELAKMAKAVKSSSPPSHSTRSSGSESR